MFYFRYHFFDLYPDIFLTFHPQLLRLTSQISIILSALFGVFLTKSYLALLAVNGIWHA